MAPQERIRHRLLLVCAIAAAAGCLSSSAWAFSARPLMRPIGSVQGGGLGGSVSNAGDVNGDGYADVIVGENHIGPGRAYVHFGGKSADSVADLTLIGESDADEFGYSVSGAGDVNGDGYADVIVGAPYNDAGGLNAGRAYVFYGGATPNPFADLFLTGTAAGDAFGGSVANAGDLNGDGYADVVVGARYHDAGGTDAGRAYAYFGGPAADAVPDLTLTGAAAFDYFGTSVACAGDINKDGYVDLIVGAFYNDGAGTDVGAAYLYYGGASPDATSDLILRGTGVSDHFGISVAGAGDMNGDGYADVIVGAANNDANGFDAGRAYVFYGGALANSGVDLVLTGAAALDNLGYSVSGGGDVNGDGYADVIVGAYGYDTAAQDVGGAHVYYGGVLPDAVADLVVTGPAPQDMFGVSVAMAGDCDGDGRADLIVGAPWLDSSTGRAYAFTSRPYELQSPNREEQWIVGREERVRWLGADPADLWISLDGGLSYALLASSVGGRDQNDFPIISPNQVTTSARIRVSPVGEPITAANTDASDGFFSILAPVIPPKAASRLQVTSTGSGAGDLFGYSASGAGDVNGDGYADVIVGAPQNDVGGTDAGRAYVYFGGLGADGVADLTVTGTVAGDQLGLSVAGAGDMNGDGYADLIVGAPLNDAGGADAGRAYVYYGGPAGDTVADLTLTGAAAGDNFGYSVAGAGDVNRDGYGDVIVGAILNDTGGGDAGRAYVYYGGPAADAVADLTLTGAAPADLFGFSVAGAGDVNGDRYADLIVGGYRNDAAGVNAGRAYVYYGGRAPDAVADLVLTGASAGDLFGRSVAGAGDVNGDGYADVIVGALANDVGGADAGRVYLYFGGPAADAQFDLALTGAVAGDNFGSCVAGAGDVNGDGYADLIVGANTNDAGGTDAGRAYLYYGGPIPSGTAAHIVTGAAPGDLLGRSASGAGDVNGDGYPDLIIGAYQNDAGGADAGRAYLYDCNRYFVSAPNGGETWNVGATKTISWLGAERADIWLSLDGGISQQLIESGVGGLPLNVLTIRVPHTPTKFARIRITPANAALQGSDWSDSLFTVQTSVALLSLLVAPAPDRAGAAVISWGTDPGPEDLAGYRLEKSATGGASSWQTLLSLTKETSCLDPAASPAGARYRLYAVNGFGEELLLGETFLRPSAPLTAWPMPYRGGTLSLSFATASAVGGAPAHVEVALYDVRGRLVRTIARGSYPAGYQSAFWDGLDDRGRAVAAGIYFMRAQSADHVERLKVVVLR